MSTTFRRDIRRDAAAATTPVHDAPMGGDLVDPLSGSVLGAENASARNGAPVQMKGPPTDASKGGDAKGKSAPASPPKAEKAPPKPDVKPPAKSSSEKKPASDPSK